MLDTKNVLDCLDDFQKYLRYNPKNGNFYWLKNTGRGFKGDFAGEVTHLGYIVIGFNYQLYSAHRLAWLFTHGDWPFQVINHINGIRFDNRIENLEDISQEENMRHRGKYTWMFKYGEFN